MDIVKLFNMAKELGDGTKGSHALLAMLTQVMFASANVCSITGQKYFEIEDGKIDDIVLADIESALKEVGMPFHHQLVHHYRRPSKLTLFLDNPKGDEESFFRWHCKRLGF